MWLDIMLVGFLLFGIGALIAAKWDDWKKSHKAKEKHA